jgi:nitrite reductase (NADH) large subunit
MKNYIIVGCGVAGISAAVNIRKLDPTGNITIFSDESYPFYARIRLPEIIAGEISPEKLIIYPSDWYAGNKIDLHLDEPITEFDPQNNRITSTKGKSYSYDYLLLATGSHPQFPPIDGVEKVGVFTLRSIKDALTIKEYAEKSRKAIVIGGGLLGLEAGNGLRKAGLEVNVIEFFPRLLPRQMDIPGAEILKSQMEEMGFRFYLDAKTKEILGNEKVKGVLLADGQRIEGDLVLISAGITIKPFLDIDLKLGRGVIVDDRMQTSIDNIYAAGDLVEHRGIFYGIWPASQQQGEAAGINMAGGDRIYQGTVPSNTLKVVGIDFVSAGEIDVEGKYNSLVKKDTEKYIYRKLVMKGEVPIGCILLGDTTNKKVFLTAIDKKKSISAEKMAL